MKTILKNFHRIAFITTLVLALASCKKKDPVETPTASLVQQGSGVFVGNEGAFNAGNATVMHYKFNDVAASVDLFSKVNNAPLGDVFQSMTIQHGSLYLVVNNSQKIQKVGLPNFNLTKVITGLPSPRFMAFTDNNTAFVTNLFSNELTRLVSDEVNGSITLPHWSDAILFHNNKLFVTAPESDKLYICDPSTMSVTDSITTAIGGNALVKDADGMLWEYCGGEPWNSIEGALVRINPNTLQVIENYSLGMTLSVSGRLCTNANADTLYFLNGDVYRMRFDDALPTQPFILADCRSLYGLYRHPTKSLLFVTDAKDFTQKGDLFMYSAEGDFQKQVEVGVAPSQVLAY